MARRAGFGITIATEAAVGYGAVSPRYRAMLPSHSVSMKHRFVPLYDQRNQLQSEALFMQVVGRAVGPDTVLYRPTQ